MGLEWARQPEPALVRGCSLSLPQLQAPLQALSEGHGMQLQRLSTWVKAVKCCDAQRL